LLTKNLETQIKRELAAEKRSTLSRSVERDKLRTEPKGETCTLRAGDSVAASILNQQAEFVRAAYPLEQIATMLYSLPVGSKDALVRVCSRD
jgi:hypothetical protein